MKHKITQFFSVNLSFIVGFAMSAAVAFLLVSHFQHTILQTWFGMRSNQASQFSQVDAMSIAYADSAVAPSQDLGCGCALCCSIPGL